MWELRTPLPSRLSFVSQLSHLSLSRFSPVFSRTLTLAIYHSPFLSLPSCVFPPPLGTSLSDSVCCEMKYLSVLAGPRHPLSSTLFCLCCDHVKGVLWTVPDLNSFISTTFLLLPSRYKFISLCFSAWSITSSCLISYRIYSMICTHD